MSKFVDLFKKIEARVDFFYGALFGLLPLLFGAGWFALVSVPACSILYAMGGDNDFASGWRDVGCSAANSLCLILATGNLLFLGAGVATFGLFTIGLGLPSTQPYDEGSPVGRFFWALAVKHTHLDPSGDSSDAMRKRIEERANLYTHAFLYASAWAIYFAASILRGRLF